MNQKAADSVKKRKRSSTSSTPPSSASTSTPRPSKTSKTSKTSKPKCQIPWPPAFAALQTLHRALNIVSSFMSTRKHMATTFQMLQSAVSSNLKREVTIEDVARVVALRPEGFLFEYVDEGMLRTLDLDPFEGIVANGVPKGASWLRADGVERYGGEEREEHDVNKTNEEDQEHVLYFEFVDNGKKKTESGAGTGEGGAARPKRRPKDDGRAPVINQKKLMVAINKRNEIFEAAITLFINLALVNNEDPVQALESIGKQHIPQPPTPPTLIRKEAQDAPSRIPNIRAPFSEIIPTLKNLSFYHDQIPASGHWTTPATPPLYAPLTFLLSQNLVNALYNAHSIHQFYTHQAEALNALNAGNNVLIATATASGKSLIYQLPVLRALEEDPEMRALYIFPTKALAQDQRQSLKETLRYLEGREETVVESFDGDTPGWQREEIRRDARVIFTNPDMLHMTILPNHASWSHVLANLRYIVVDELHYYDGRLGAHLAYIMRRLRRLCTLYSNLNPLIISCSATVSNPLPHFNRLFSVPTTLITTDGSPRTYRHHLCWNTFSPALAPLAAQDPQHSLKQVTRLFTALLLRGVRLLTFCPTRNQCELLLNSIHQSLTSTGRHDAATLVAAYRGGYTSQDRRALESDMFSGRLRGLVATSALELGIDIGSLDCVISWGFPRNGIAGWRQQIGRAGRRGGDALAILVGDRRGRDQLYMEEPGLLLTKGVAEMWSDLGGREIREGQMNCAAGEMPVDLGDLLDCELFGPELERFLRPGDGTVAPLVEDRFKPGVFHPREVYRPVPARRVNIRDIESDMVAVIDLTNGRFALLEEVELGRATFLLFEGALYLHQGRVYRVREYNARERVAKAEFVRADDGGDMDR